VETRKGLPVAKTALQADSGFDGRSGWMDVFSDRARAVRWECMNKGFFSIGTDALVVGRHGTGRRWQFRQ
jgi:hypothetical protein